MTFLIPLLIGLAAATPAGVLLGRKLLAGKLKNQELEIKQKGELLLKEAEEKAEILKKDKLLEAKEKFLQMKMNLERENQQKLHSIQDNLAKLKERELFIRQKTEENQRKENEIMRLREDIERQITFYDRKKEELDKMH